jgi:hypothetical protein
VAGQNDGLLDGQEAIRPPVPALHLDHGIVPVPHSPALDGHVLGGPRPDVLEDLVDVLFADLGCPPGDLDRPVVGKLEFREDLESGRAPQGLSLLVLQVPEDRYVDGVQPESPQFLFEDAGDEGIVDVVLDVVFEEAADHIPGRVPLAETGELDLAGIFAEDLLVFLPDLVGRDLELDLLAARADIREATLSSRCVHFFFSSSPWILVPDISRQSGTRTRTPSSGTRS